MAALIDGAEVEGRFDPPVLTDSLQLRQVKVVKGHFALQGKHATFERSRVAVIENLGGGLRYRGADADDSELIEEIVRAIGKGKKVDVRIRDGRRMNVHLTAVESDHFTVLRGTKLVKVSYADVVEIKPGRMDKPATVAFSVVFGAALIGLYYWMMSLAFASGYGEGA